MKPKSQRFENWELIDGLLDQVLDLEADQREDHLERVCDDAAIRAEVLQLANLGDRSNPLLDQPALDLSPSLAEELGKRLQPQSAHDSPDTASPGDVHQRLGSWQIDGPLGAGGMGRVFLARRADDAYQQKAAVKVLRWEMAEPEVVARFQRERQILADLEHPNIARLLDGGVSATGLPWLAMELVEGSPIDAYAEEHELDVDARLELLEQVCRAVQFAHTRFIIHRDLKPSNILVTTTGQVKLLDFGVAKLLLKDPATASSALPDLTLLTAPMTLRYAAPEQIEHHEASTATDVWSLGVVLYSLLTDHHPFDLEPGNARALEDAIVGREPRPPSRVVTDRQLGRLLRGDLDNIVLRSLAKEPEGRYASAGELAGDLSRHRRRLPVIARPPTMGYLASRFLQRHRTAAIAAGIGLATVLVLALWFTVQLRNERDAARREARKAKQVTDFVTTLFETNDPGSSEGREITARQLLEKGSERIDEELGELPAVRAEMKRVMGDLYYALGDYEASQGHLEEALALARSEPTVGQQELGGILGALGLLFTEIGDYERAEPLMQEALSVRREALGERSAGTATALNDLGLLFAYRGDYDEAIPVLRGALALRRDVHGDQHPEVAGTIGNLGLATKWSGDFEAAEPLYREALAMHRATQPAGHPDIATQLDNLGVLLGQSGRWDEAEEAALEALDLRRSTLGANHPDVALNLNNLGSMFLVMGDLERAIEMSSQALAANIETFGPGAVRVATNHGNVGNTLVRLGRLDEAYGHLERALEIRRQSLGEQHYETGLSYSTFARVLQRKGDLQRAESLARRGLVIVEQALDSPHPQIAGNRATLAWILIERGSAPEAVGLLEQARLDQMEVLSDGHPHRRTSAMMLGVALAQLDRGDEALPLLRGAFSDGQDTKTAASPSPLETAARASLAGLEKESRE